MMYVRYPLSLRQVEDLLFERGIDICHETVRFWWNRFGPMFGAEIRKRRVQNHSYSLWRWHLDEIFARNNGLGRRSENGAFKTIRILSGAGIWTRFLRVTTARHIIFGGQ